MWKKDLLAGFPTGVVSYSLNIVEINGQTLTPPKDFYEIHPVFEGNSLSPSLLIDSIGFAYSKIQARTTMYSILIFKSN